MAICWISHLLQTWKLKTATKEGPAAGIAAPMKTRSFSLKNWGSEHAPWHILAIRRQEQCDGYARVHRVVIFRQTHGCSWLKLSWKCRWYSLAKILWCSLCLPRRKKHRITLVAFVESNVAMRTSQLNCRFLAGKMTRFWGLTACGRQERPQKLIF